MAEYASKLDELRAQVLLRRLSRRDTLRRAVVLGLSAPVIGGLLAACGDDEDDPTATTEAGGEATATTGGGQTEGTATTGDEGEPTETGEAEATGTEGEEGEATGTGEAEGTEPSGSGDAGEFIESPDRLMGMTMEEGTAGGVLIEGSFSDISTLNPIMTSDVPSGDVQAFIFETLAEPNPETIEPVGSLAAAWAVSEDGSTWTLRLQEGVTWQDGEAFSADDVKFTYDLHLNPETNSPRTADFESKIAGIEVVDDLTIAFTLVNPISDFLLDLGVYGIIAEHVWADVAPADIAADPGSTGQDPARVVGTGPFIFEQWTVEDNASVVRYDDYWDGAPYLDQIIYKVVPDQAAGVQQLITGELDWFAIPEAQVAEVEGSSDIGIYESPTLSFTFYGTNMDPEKTTLFQEVEVRKALMYALDREAMIQTIRFGYGEVAIGTMPVLSWAYNPDGIEETYPYDPEMAMQLLDEAGWVAGDDGVRAKDGTPLAFSMYTNAGNQAREAYLTAAQEFWAQIGVEMTPQLEPFPALVERITETFDFEVVLIGFNWSATPDQSVMWGCESYPLGFNFVRYCNEEVDAIAAEALSEPDQATRIELYTQMQNLVLADLPMAVLDFPTAINGLNNRVHNVFPSSVNERWNCETWWIES